MLLSKYFYLVSSFQMGNKTHFELNNLKLHFEKQWRHVYLIIYI